MANSSRAHHPGGRGTLLMNQGDEAPIADQPEPAALAFVETAYAAYNSGDAQAWAEVRGADLDFL